MIELKNINNCYQGIRMDENGKVYRKKISQIVYTWNEDKQQFTVSLAPWYKEFLKKNRLVAYLKEADIPESILDYDVKTYIGPDKEENIKALQSYIEEYKNYKGHCIFFVGKPGTQKTTVSWWVARELISQSFIVKYILMNDLIKMLQAESFDDTIDYVDDYFQCDLLIIDRVFQKDQVTLYKSGYQIAFLDNFLRKRVDQMGKGILFISNTPLDEIAGQGFNADIEDFVRRKTVNTVFEFKDRYTLKDDFPIGNIFKNLSVKD